MAQITDQNDMFRLYMYTYRHTYKQDAHTLIHTYINVFTAKVYILTSSQIYPKKSKQQTHKSLQLITLKRSVYSERLVEMILKCHAFPELYTT